MEGVLYLKKQGILKNWNKFYAVLDE